MTINFLEQLTVHSGRSTEKVMALHSSTLAWKIPWMEELGRLQSMGLLRVRHDWETSLSLFTFMHWRRKWQPTPVFLPRESQGRGAWWAAVYGVTQSRTQLKRLSSSSSKLCWTWFSNYLGLFVCSLTWHVQILVSKGAPCLSLRPSHQPLTLIPPKQEVSRAAGGPTPTRPGRKRELKRDHKLFPTFSGPQRSFFSIKP